jgi:hypothetical protein
VLHLGCRYPGESTGFTQRCKSWQEAFSKAYGDGLLQPFNKVFKAPEYQRKCTVKTREQFSALFRWSTEMPVYLELSMASSPILSSVWMTESGNLQNWWVVSAAHHQLVQPTMPCRISFFYSGVINSGGVGPIFFWKSGKQTRHCQWQLQQISMWMLAILATQDMG